MTAQRGAALGIAVVALASSVYRAITQSITIDEAATYLDFVSTGWDAFFNRYDANNHPLYTLLAKASISAFGVSEWALRLPALCGAAIFLLSLWRILQREFKDSWWTPLGMALVALNPYVLDFFVAARGYGLGCGFLLAGIDAMLAGRIAWAGVAMGLAFATNLTFAFPAGAASIAIVLIRRSLTPGFLHAGLWLSIGAAIEYGPVRNATPEHFYFGVDTLRETAATLVRVTFFHHTLGEIRETERIGAVVAGITLLLGIWLGMRDQSRLTRLLGGICASCIALLIAAHLIAGVRYPLFRTAIYWLPLWSLLMLAGARRLGKFAAIPLALLACWFAAQWKVDYFHEWTFCANTREIAQAVERSRRGGGRVTVVATWPLVSSLEFYRRMYGWDWMEPITRERTPGATRADFYALMQDDLKLLDNARSPALRPLLTNGRSLAVLAVAEDYLALP